MNQTTSTMIAINLQENPSVKFEDIYSLIHRKRTAAQFSIRATVHTTLKYSPGELAFGQNILYPSRKIKQKMF